MVEVLASAVLLGLLGAGHCLGMCGGFAAALAYAIPQQHKRQRFALLLAYNLGRISSYAVAGAIAAGGQNLVFDSGYPLARTIAGLLLIAVGLYQAQIWMGITVLEQIGQKLWKFIAPISRRMLPVYTVPKALLLGAVWGWLPCGLVYSMLAFAAMQANAQIGALAMAAFGAGTLPAVFAGGLAATWVRGWLARKWLKNALAFSFVAFGFWTVASAWYHHLAHAGHQQHGNHTEHSMPALTPANDHSRHHHHESGSQ